MEVKKIFSSRIANKLIHQGFKMVGVEANMIKPQYDVFLFEATNELLQAFDKILLEDQKKGS